MTQPTFELPLPRVKLAFSDYNLGLTPPLADAHAKIGVAWDGPMTPVRAMSGRQVAETFVGGPLASAAAIALLQTAPVILQRVAADIPGRVESDVLEPGVAAAVEFGGSPNGDFRIGVQLTRAASLTGASAVRYNIDGVWTDEIAVNSPDMPQPIENTGVTVRLLAPALGETYWASVVGPAANLYGLVTALATLLDTRPNLRFVHILGAATPALVAAVDSILAEREARAYYTHVVLEAPPRSPLQGMSAYLDEMQQWFAGVFSTRVSIALDGGQMYNPLTKRVEKHNSAWKATAVRPTRPVGEAPYRTRTGPMIGMTGDLAFDAGLVGSSGRFLSLRTFDALNGIYVGHWPTLAPQGSDYNEVQRREVADEAARAGYAAALSYLGESVRVDTTTGRILETEAQAFEAFVAGRVQARLGSNISGVRVSLNREENIFSTEHVEFTVSIIPLGYLKYIDVVVGFENPYLNATADAVEAPAPAPTPAPTEGPK